MRNKLTAPLVLALTLNTFAANIPKYCSEEIIALSQKNGFDSGKFIKDLVPAVAKAKLQAKAPFGKPKDNDKTDIGLTFGCLKQFPEEPKQMQTLLEDIGLGMAKGLTAESKNNTNIANNVNASNQPNLKECDAVFNPNKKFCYDGSIYDLCDGMSYNPTTHICSGDIANRAMCGGVQYNPLKQGCKNNNVLAVCGGIEYNPTTHDCKDNVIFPKCGATIYDPKTQICKDNVALSKCGTTLYDSKKQACKDNIVLSKCGATEFYDPQTQVCKNNTVLSRCGATTYDPQTQVCKDNIVLSRCGATEFYNPNTHECRYNSVFAK